MKKVSLTNYFILLLVVIFSANAWGVSYSSQKFRNAEKIQKQFSLNKKAKVIVVLDESGTDPKAVKWAMKASVKAYQGAVNSKQDKVLKNLTAQEHSMRHRYKNLPAFSVEVNEKGLQKLINDPTVLSVQPVVQVSKFTAQGLPLLNAIRTRGIYDGTGISIAIVDDAIDYTHPNLGGGGFPNAKVIGGYDFGNDDPDPAPVLPGDIQAHGTSVAGVAGGSVDLLAEDYIGGAAPGAKIYALKFSNDLNGGLTNDGGVASWDWCITHQYDDPENPILVINNSWGVGIEIDSESVADALFPAEAMAAARCVQAGMTVVVSAGNSFFTNGIGLPAANSNTIAVGAVSDAAGVIDNTGFVAPAVGYVMPYSNSGSLLDLFAPAEEGYTLDIVGEDGYEEDEWMPTFGGTSCAAPYVSGMIATLQQANYETTGSYLTPQEVLDLLSTTGDPVTDPKASDITRPLVDLYAAVDAFGDFEAPKPNPMQWEIEPLATGLNSIYMEAVMATDESGVEYYFGCITDPNFDSPWQDSRVYYREDYAEATEYLFHVKARDTSDDQNETAWSEEALATTASGIDNLPPASNPARWGAVPRMTEVYRQKYVAMSAKTAYDENGVEYFFDCIQVTNLNNPPEIIDPDVYDSDWQTSEDYTVKAVSAGAYDGTKPRVLEVPYPYSTIQSAIDSSNDGETVVVHPGIYGGGKFSTGENIDFRGKAITVRSVDPEDPDVVANTVIDPSLNGRGTEDRAFIFQSGEGRNSVLDGFTIQNAEAYDPTAPPAPSTDGIDALGGAIFIGDNCGPTIANCVIRDSEAHGQDGSDGLNGDNGADGADGADGDDGADGTDGDGSAGGNGDGGGDGEDGGTGGDGADGEDGGDGGSAFGGAIYCGQASFPLIIDCEIINCNATGGNAGFGGNGGNGGDGGSGGGGGGGGAGGGGTVGGVGGDG
ncbi:MAG: S8 family serine peptidase, partial [Planctomycetota bacterium]